MRGLFVKFFLSLLLVFILFGLLWHDGCFSMIDSPCAAFLHNLQQSAALYHAAKGAYPPDLFDPEYRALWKKTYSHSLARLIVEPAGTGLTYHVTIESFLHVHPVIFFKYSYNGPNAPPSIQGLRREGRYGLKKWPYVCYCIVLVGIVGFWIASLLRVHIKINSHSSS